MKNLVIAAIACFTSFSTLQAQTNTDSNRLSQVLQSYYHIKDALVAGNQKTAAESATAFVKNIQGISDPVLSKSKINFLLKDAGTIADAKNIDKQRAAFASFSTNMVEVAKGTKLSTGPVYVQYCPMKKASWLSSEKYIKNPYYGNAMLTCGKVTNTIQ